MHRGGARSQLRWTQRRAVCGCPHDTTKVTSRAFPFLRTNCDQSNQQMLRALRRTAALSSKASSSRSRFGPFASASPSTPSASASASTPPNPSSIPASATRAFTSIASARPLSTVLTSPLGCVRQVPLNPLPNTDPRNRNWRLLASGIPLRAGERPRYGLGRR
ncbi:hypothetical protein BC830DRAFT_803388 [Chytriomyces sp. MP71]|nr:hypothetical protein BC830DRAFT_803388 [Chytriomyces sp. MP71]